MMDISTIIQVKYPGSSLGVDFELTNFGSAPTPQGLTGIHITQWNLPDPQPTIEELLEWADKNQELINDVRGGIALLESELVNARMLTMAAESLERDGIISADRWRQKEQGIKEKVGSKQKSA